MPELRNAVSALRLKLHRQPTDHDILFLFYVKSHQILLQQDSNLRALACMPVFGNWNISQTRWGVGFKSMVTNLPGRDWITNHNSYWTNASGLKVSNLLDFIYINKFEQNATQSCAGNVLNLVVVSSVIYPILLVTDSIPCVDHFNPPFAVLVFLLRHCECCIQKYILCRNGNLIIRTNTSKAITVTRPWVKRALIRLLKLSLRNSQAP